LATRRAADDIAGHGGVFAPAFGLGLVTKPQCHFASVLVSSRPLRLLK
jgi:hypothetical protein